jgi:hypothetical protein
VVDAKQRKSGIDGRLRRHEGGFAAGDGVCILKKHQLSQLAQRLDASFSTELAKSGLLMERMQCQRTRTLPDLTQRRNAFRRHNAASSIPSRLHYSRYSFVQTAQEKLGSRTHLYVPDMKGTHGSRQQGRIYLRYRHVLARLTKVMTNTTCYCDLPPLAIPFKSSKSGSRLIDFDG